MGAKTLKELALPTVRESPLDYEDWMGGYYHNDFYCTNCSEHLDKMVKKGVRANTVTIECDNCGCEVTG